MFSKFGGLLSDSRPTVQPYDKEPRDSDSGILPLRFKHFSQSPRKFQALECVTNTLIFAGLPFLRGDQ